MRSLNTLCLARVSHGNPKFDEFWHISATVSCSGVAEKAFVVTALLMMPIDG